MYIEKRYENINKNRIIYCPLCHSVETKLIYIGNKRDNNRFYYHCNNCDLIFVEKWQQLYSKEELDRYKEHDNDVYDLGYRSFLNKIVEEVVPLINKEKLGLDFGAGPGPALALMMKERGFNMDIYDPYFHRDNNLLSKKYDFVIATEVVEHFSNPFIEFTKLNKLINNNGYLAIMTKLYKNSDDFKNWYYKNDFTHISFYSKKTMKWIADKFQYRVEFPKKNIIIFKKLRR